MSEKYNINDYLRIWNGYKKQMDKLFPIGNRDVLHFINYNMTCFFLYFRNYKKGLVEGLRITKDVIEEVYEKDLIKKVRKRKRNPTLKDYYNLHRRYDRLTDKLFKGKNPMFCYFLENIFFLFFDQYERLEQALKIARFIYNDWKDVSDEEIKKITSGKFENAVTNNSTKSVWIAGKVSGKTVVRQLKPGESSTKYFKETDAIIPTNDCKINGKSAGAFEMGLADIEIKDNETINEAEREADGESLVLIPFEKVRYIGKKAAEDLDYVLPTEEEKEEKKDEEREEEKIDEKLPDQQSKSAQ